jgi:hypothetical protein
MIRVAEPLAWEVDLEPSRVSGQLRLVPDDIFQAGDSSHGEVVTAMAAEIPADPEIIETLASHLVRLRPGSRCCWCSGSLVQGEGGGPLRLECRSCGALVEAPDSVHDGDVRL